ncbi:alpha-1,4-N-acetylglucosaminyltransferase-like [Discoglossus pictus]
MLNSIKVVVLLLLMSVFGFIYRISYGQTCISCISFFSEENKQDKLTSPNNNLRRYQPASYKDILSQGNGIIFMETTDRLEPRPLVLCAIESAARVYPDRPVAFFMKGLANRTEEELENITKNSFPTLSSFNNVHIFPLALKEIFKDTPLLPWFLKFLEKNSTIHGDLSAKNDSKIVNPKLERHWIHVSSDGCRLALIWKYGGIYMDTDIISIRPIPYDNFLAAQSSQYSSNGVFGLSQGHNFSWISMEDFVQNYNGAVWGHQGPGLFTRVLNKFCSIPKFQSVEDVMCGNISFLNPQRFYPIAYPSWKLYYQVWKTQPTFNDSFALHLWNYMNKETETVVPGSNTLVDNLYQHHCPVTYASLKRNEITQ